MYCRNVCTSKYFAGWKILREFEFTYLLLLEILAQASLNICVDI